MQKGSFDGRTDELAVGTKRLEWRIAGAST